MAIEPTSTVYERIYHYTSMEGARGILTSKCLWATHIKLMNDLSEFHLFKEPLEAFLRPHVFDEYTKLITETPHARSRIEMSGGLNAAVDHDTVAVIDAIYRAQGGEVYVTSFCGEHEDEYVNTNGLLSQWRGYGHDGGLALVFNTKGLENLLELESNTFDGYGYIADVIYSGDQARFDKELSALLPNIGDYVRELFGAMRSGKDEAPNAGKMYEAFIKSAARYKHRGFREENEIRIVALPDNYDSEYLDTARKDATILRGEKQRYFRGSDKHIPYISLFEKLETPLPIERIIVGPHRDKERRAAALSVMLRKTPIDVTISDIPFSS